MTDLNQRIECEDAFERLETEFKKMHLSVTEELLPPQPDEVKTLMYKMDKLLKLIESK